MRIKPSLGGRDFGFLFTLLIISVISYCLFSPINSTYYNSDHAVHVLMTAKFTFPSDLYYWGQDRLGSLLPLLSHLVYLVIPAKPILIISIVQYIFLFFSCLVFASLFKSNISKIIVSVAFFFPPRQFIDLLHIGHPYSAQFFLLAIFIYLYERIKNSNFEHRRDIYASGFAALCLFLTVWVSELSIVFILAIGSVFIKERILSRTSRNNLILSYKKNYNYLIIISLLAFLSVAVFIVFAKTHSTPYPNYSLLNNRAELLTMIQEISERITSSILFIDEEIYGNLYVVFAVAFVFLTIIYRRYYNPVGVTWYYFFLLSSFYSLLVVLFSKWVILNGIGSRYFIVTYICFTLYLLFTLERLSKHRTFLSLILLATTLVGLCYASYERLAQTSIYSTLLQFSKQPKTAIIAQYWSSYKYSSINPDSILATPHDKDYVRSGREVGQVLKCENIYLIKNDWFNLFPDSITQFGYKLRKGNDSIVIGNTVLQRYHNLGLETCYNYSNLYTNIGTVIPTTDERKKVIFSSNKIGTLSFGPYIYLYPGKYKVTFFILSNEGSAKTVALSLRATSLGGKRILATREVLDKEFSGQFKGFELQFEISKFEELVEFITETKNEDPYWFDYCKIEQI